MGLGVAVRAPLRVEGGDSERYGGVAYPPEHDVVGDREPGLQAPAARVTEAQQRRAGLGGSRTTRVSAKVVGDELVVSGRPARVRERRIHATLVDQQLPFGPRGAPLFS